jgi:hypothetical protein
MGHATAREANYPEIGDDEHIVHLVVDNFEDNDPAARLTPSGLEVLKRIHYEIWMRWVNDWRNDTITPIAGTNKDVVLAAFRAGLQSGLTIADLLKLLNTAVEQPVSRDTLEDDGIRLANAILPMCLLCHRRSGHAGHPAGLERE